MGSRGLDVADAERQDGQRLWSALRAASDEDMQEMHKWLSASLDAMPSQQPKLITAIQAEHKTKLTSAAFMHCFLAHFHHLTSGTNDAPTQNGTSDAVSANVTGAVRMPTAEPTARAFKADDFPALGATATTATTKASPAHRPAMRPKRRITTTLISAAPQSASTPASSFPLSDSESPPGLAQTLPLPIPSKNLLERRLNPNAKPSIGDNARASGGKSTWGAKEGPAADSSSFAGCISPPRTRTMVAPPSITQLSAKQKRSRRIELRQQSTSPSNEALPVEEKPSVDPGVNVQAAVLYAFAIKKRLIYSTSFEVETLVSLLFRPECQVCAKQSSGIADVCPAPSEFCWNKNCTEFASIVIRAIVPVIEQLGTGLVRLICDCLRDLDICPAVVEHLEAALARTEDLRVQESARIGCSLPIETRASSVRDFALPFCEEVDSRLHYRSPAESVLYSNREKLRDAFLSLLRQFQKQQNSLVGIESSNFAQSTADAARALLSDVAPENRWWFAKFFVMELIQVGSNPLGESDKDLVLKIMGDKQVEKNPDRLRKLHRRFSSQKQSHTAMPIKQKASGNGSSTNSSTTSNRTPAHQNHSQASKTQASSPHPVSPVFESMKYFFGENQLFFFHFLLSCDSFEFSVLVERHLKQQFWLLWSKKEPSDPRKTFTEDVLKLRVIAKFLGYFRFAPQWNFSSAFRFEAHDNVAFQAAKREALAAMEEAQVHDRFDLYRLLETSWQEWTLAKCIPWICEYLTMLAGDKLSRETTAIRNVLAFIEQLYRSPRLTALGETGMHISLQIERLWHHLGMDPMSSHHARSKPQRNLPTASHSAPEGSLDSLPFLASKLFVQSCVTELDDVRGHIQRRSKPLHHVGETRRLHMGSALSMVRKVRPMQIRGQDTTDNSDNAKAPDSSTSSSSSDLRPESGPDDQLTASLFKLHPEFKCLVDVVVDMVVTNVCEYVVNDVVEPHVEGLVRECANASHLTNATKSDDTDCVATFNELIASRMRQQEQRVIQLAAEQSQSLCTDRVRASVQTLISPSCHPVLIETVVSVALRKTDHALRTLVRKRVHTEFVRRVASRQKAVVKEATANSRSKPTEEPVVRALSAMFDEADDQEDKDRHANLLQALCSSSAEVARLSASVDDATPWEKTVKPVCLALRVFVRHLRDHEKVLNGDGDTSTMWLTQWWDSTWRVVHSSCRVLRVMWTAPPMELGASDNKLAHKLVEFLSAVLTIMRATLPANCSTSDRRLQFVTQFVEQSVLALAKHLSISPSSRSSESVFVATASSLLAAASHHPQRCEVTAESSNKLMDRIITEVRQAAKPADAS
ncbi:TPA: hypothetical protein N0F65_010247 [Lagenidium giganteum]|uniref:Uncharacterized protein n=1 Tax=Lagenidium giganteum TaxID=4803 RepID=A0AAV2Z0N7_9STRA|nr:TPA: hypothetical protein N0F65_010247 [Lagenidium giganteum]